MYDLRAYCLGLSSALYASNSFPILLGYGGKPSLNMIVTVVGGICNIIFDILLIVVLDMGILGAALATCSGALASPLIPLVFFLTSKKSPLRLGKCRFDRKAMLKACTNGSAEFLTQFSTGLVAMHYNMQMMKVADNDGVAAYGAVGYLAYILGVPLMAKILVGYDQTLYNMTIGGANIYAISFLFMGFGVFGVALYTALNDGAMAVILSVLRTLILQVVCVLLLPALFGLSGMGWAIVVAELLSAIVAVGFYTKLKGKYHYA